MTISGEWSPYEDVDGYLQFYQNRFYESEYFRESNGLTLLQDETVETAGMKRAADALLRGGQCPALQGLHLCLPEAGQKLYALSLPGREL